VTALRVFTDAAGNISALPLQNTKTAFVSEGRLIQFFAGGDLAGLQKGFDEFSVAADGQAENCLNPLPSGTSGSVSIRCSADSNRLLRRLAVGMSAD
jgi:hypothetical protein